jgi:hypothetical protein
MTIAHILGIPVEENVAALATASVAIASTVTVARVRLGRLSRRLRRGLGQGRRER